MELIREGKLWVFPPESKATIHGPVAAYSRLTPIRKDYNPFSALTPDDDDTPEEDSSVSLGVEANPLSNPHSKSTAVMNPLFPLQVDSDTQHDSGGVRSCIECGVDLALQTGAFPAF